MGTQEDCSPELILVNGERTNVVNCTDRALAYGDGLFETIALSASEPQHWSRHFARLQAGAARLYLACPAETLWRADLEVLLTSRVPAQHSVLKLLLSRGSARRGYAPDATTSPTRITQLLPSPTASPPAPFIAIACETRLARNPALAGLKHLNRLEQVLGAREVALANAHEGLMYDVEANLIEGTRSNIFLVCKEQLWTPLLSHSGVAGVMRGIVLDYAREWGIETHEKTLSERDLAGCEEVFFTNSLVGVQAVNVLCSGAHRRGLATAFTRSLHARLRHEQLLP